MDESEIHGTKYFATLAADIENPSVKYMIKCATLEQAPNAQTVIRAVDDAVRYLPKCRTKVIQLKTCGMTSIRYLLETDFTTIAAIFDKKKSEHIALCQRFVLLRKSTPTSVNIERFFSQLGKLLQKDRNFNTENIEIYICVLYLYNSNCKSPKKSHSLSVRSQRHRLLGPTVNRPVNY